MLILYGFRDRDLEMKSGSFDCPNCGKRRYCKQRKIESWLDLFFIPVCPWKIQTEYFQCDDCRQSFEKPTLRRFLPAGGLLRSDLKAELRSGSPIEAIAERLVQSGIDPEMAAEVIHEIAGEIRSRCPPCDLTYVEGISTCKLCGGSPVKSAKKKGGFLDELD